VEEEIEQKEFDILPVFGEGERNCEKGGGHHKSAGKAASRVEKVQRLG